MVLGTPTDTRWIRKFFWNPTIAHLGKISFTIYLWQQLATANYPDVSPLFTLVALAVVFMLAACSYRFFELPLMRLGSSYARVAAAKSSASSVIHKRSSVL
jgi:peptidoglycan/LPS O-acetylase OafA/YrhL